MKLSPLLAIAVLALLGGKLLIDRSTQSSASSLQRLLPATPAPAARIPATAPVPTRIEAPSVESVFQCDGRRRCTQMRSCAEARFFLATCPGAEMDGDRDGIPCEDQHCVSSDTQPHAPR